MISIGWDTGLNLACTWIEATPGKRPRFAGSRKIRVGHKVALAKPRRFRGNGADRMQYNRTVVDDEDLERLHAEVTGLIRSIVDSAEPSSDVAMAVERVRRVSPRARFGSDMATNLCDTGWIGGEVAAVGRTILGAAHVKTVTESEWRKMVIGTKAPADMSEDQAIGTIVPLAIDGWPARSSADQRDAAGPALWCIPHVRAHGLRVHASISAVGR